MKMTFYLGSQFVLNSGIRDNRTTIENMNQGEEWVLDCIIKDSTGEPVSDFIFSMGEYIYNSHSGCYNLREGAISFETRAPTSEENNGVVSGQNRKIITVNSTSYTEETFKKNSKVYLKIKPNAVETEPQEWYIEKIALYKKSIGADGKIIVPDYEETQSKAAREFVETSTVEKRYHYFSTWLIDENNPNKIINKEAMPTCIAT
jgi:hypothetical protein